MAFADNLASIAAAFLGTPGNQNLGAIGYQKLPSGLILQWGSAANTATTEGTAQTVSFPIPFPNAVLNVTGTGTNTNPTVTHRVCIESDTLTLNSFNWSYGDGNATAGSRAINWFAIGY